MRKAIKPGLFAVLSIAIGALPAVATGQPYPTKPIRMIVPFPPGGLMDIIGRITAEPLSQRLGQPVVVENRAGAAGTLGVEAGAKAPGDGYTLTLGATGTLASAPALYPRLGYDPIKSFSPVSLVASAPFLVVAHPSIEATSLRGLIELARSTPNRLHFASVGSGSLPHVAGEMFKASTGVALVHVPYTSLQTAMTDLLSGRIEVMFNQLAPVQAHIATGKLKALAVAAPRRIAQLPAVPTAAEGGLSGFELSIWSGLLVPSGTPEKIVSRLNAEVSAILANSAVQEKLAAQGFEPSGGSPAHFAALIEAEIAKWSRVIQAAGIKLE